MQQSLLIVMSMTLVASILVSVSLFMRLREKQRDLADIHRVYITSIDELHDLVHRGLYNHIDRFPKALHPYIHASNALCEALIHSHFRHVGVISRQHFKAQFAEDFSVVHSYRMQRLKEAHIHDLNGEKEAFLHAPCPDEALVLIGKINSVIFGSLAIQRHPN